MKSNPNPNSNPHPSMHVPGGEPPYYSLDDYYVRCLGPRLDTLRDEGYITLEMHRDFVRYVEDAKWRVKARKGAPDRVV